MRSGPSRTRRGRTRHEVPTPESRVAGLFLMLDAYLVLAHVELLQPRTVALYQHDALLPPLVAAVDMTAALARLAERAAEVTQLHLPLAGPHHPDPPTWGSPAAGVSAYTGAAASGPRHRCAPVVRWLSNMVEQQSAVAGPVRRRAGPPARPGGGARPVQDRLIFTKREAVALWRRAGYPPEVIAAAAAAVSDPIDVERDAAVLARHGITRSALTASFGDSP